MNVVRCQWAETENMIAYHDHEWGIPVHDDYKLFEFLILEGAQAGLSWQTVLNKREGYRMAYHSFDPQQVAQFTARDEKRLREDAGIIRNRLKIKASIENAKRFLDVQQEFGSFDNYIWKFTDYKTIKNRWKTMSDIPATSGISDVLSKDLKRRGFKFVGSTIIYAHMQATGMVNDHIMSCFRYSQV